MLEEMECGSLVQPLLDWYTENRRILPWREDPSPYHVWISEIMLQQTRVEAVIPYYRRFLESLPDLQSLAECPQDRLLKLWEGLGYYNRVRNMQKAAQIVMEQYGGLLPEDPQILLSLSGIGSYTAGAIASIAYKKAVPAVDGNVLRVLMRVTADDSDIAKGPVKKKTEQYLQQMMDRDFLEEPSKAGIFNQALMDLGACVCVPNGAALCHACPWEQLCLGKKRGMTDRLPVKSKKQPRRVEKKTVLLIRDGEKVMIRKRPDQGLLAGLYEYPNLPGHLCEKEVLDSIRNMHLQPLYIEKLEDAKHIFSHVEWHMTAYLIRVDSLTSHDADVLFAELQEQKEQYAIPSAFAAYRRLLYER